MNVRTLPPGDRVAVTFNGAAKSRPRPVRLLPLEAQATLIEAAYHMPRSQRVTAINRAIIEVRKNHPQFFREEI